MKSYEIAFSSQNKKQNLQRRLWFDGGNESRYITRHILTGLGHLTKLKAQRLTVLKETNYKTGIPFLKD
jgi:hypothetical protein